MCVLIPIAKNIGSGSHVISAPWLVVAIVDKIAFFCLTYIGLVRPLHKMNSSIFFIWIIIVIIAKYSHQFWILMPCCLILRKIILSRFISSSKCRCKVSSNTISFQTWFFFYDLRLTHRTRSQNSDVAFEPVYCTILYCVHRCRPTRTTKRTPKYTHHIGRRRIR